MKHAIIVTGGKQYRVAEGDVVFIEKLDVAAGESVKFDQVLAVVDGETAVFALLLLKAHPSPQMWSRTARLPRFAFTR